MLTLFCFLKRFRLESWICAMRTHLRSLQACFPVALWTQFRQTLQSVSIKHGLHNPHLVSLVFFVWVPLFITAILFFRDQNWNVMAWLRTCAKLLSCSISIVLFAHGFTTIGFVFIPVSSLETNKRKRKEKRFFQLTLFKFFKASGTKPFFRNCWSQYLKKLIGGWLLIDLSMLSITQGVIASSDDFVGEFKWSSPKFPPGIFIMGITTRWNYTIFPP